MRNKSFILHIALMLTLTVVLVVITLVHTFLPQCLIPKSTITNLALLSAAALLIDHYLAENADRNYLLTAIFAFLSFFLLPLFANFAPVWESVKIGLAGATVFTVFTFLFTASVDRLSTGPAARFAPILTGAFLVLAAQCFEGMIF